MSRAAYSLFGTPRGGRRTVPTRAPSPGVRGVPSRTIRMATAFLLSTANCDMAWEKRRNRSLSPGGPKRLERAEPDAEAAADEDLAVEAVPRADDLAQLLRAHPAPCGGGEHRGGGGG